MKDLTIKKKNSIAESKRILTKENNFPRKRGKLHLFSAPLSPPPSLLL